MEINGLWIAKQIDRRTAEFVAQGVTDEEHARRMATGSVEDAIAEGRFKCVTRHQSLGGRPWKRSSRNRRRPAA